MATVGIKGLRRVRLCSVVVLAAKLTSTYRLNYHAADCSVSFLLSNISSRVRDLSDKPKPHTHK